MKKTMEKNMKKLQVVSNAFQAIVLCVLMSVCMTSLTSCSDDDDVDASVPQNAASMLIGEWAEIKEESYNSKDELVNTSPGWKSDEAAWIFGENGYFCYGVYGSKGSYTLSGNKLTLNRTEAEGSYEVRKLTKDTLVVWHKYPDTEYSYQITYFARLSFYDDGSEPSASGETAKFVGTWHDGGSHYWYFAKNGDLYIGKDKNINNKNYITKQSWSYDSATKTLATTAHWNDIWDGTNYTWGNFVYTWTVLVLEDNFWTGQKLYASKDVSTFTKVEE